MAFYYYLTMNDKYREYEDKINKEISEIMDNKAELEAMLSKHSSDNAVEFIRELEELKKAHEAFKQKRFGFAAAALTIDQYKDRYSYSGNNPVMDLAVQQYNQNQADKQQQLESKKQEALNAVVEAYSDLESKLKSIRWIFQSYSDEYNAIITPYREKKQQEEVEKLAAQQAAEEEAAEKEKKVHKICLTVAIVATLIVSIILIIVGASMDAMGFAMAMLLFVAPLLGVCFYWLASPIVVKIMYR